MSQQVQGFARSSARNVEQAGLLMAVLGVFRLIDKSVDGVPVDLDTRPYRADDLAFIAVFVGQKTALLPDYALPLFSFELRFTFLEEGLDTLLVVLATEQLSL